MMSEKQQSLLAMASTFPFSFYNPVLQLKAVAEGNSRLFSLHHQQQQSHHTPHPQRSPSLLTAGGRSSPMDPVTQSILCSPPVSTSPRSQRDHVAHLHHLHQEHQKSLKFSIDNILSPTFGAVPRPTAGDAVRPVSGKRKPEKTASKRKYSSDSESSNSSNSTSSSHKSPKKEEQLIGKSGIATSSSTKSSSTSSSSTKSSSSSSSSSKGKEPMVWPAWVYCTRYSDRPSSGPRSRRSKKKGEKKADEKRPRTAFTAEQLARLKQEFQENRYLTEKRRQDLARDLKLNESQIKIWFQNKRAKIKKTTGQRNPLAMHLMAQGLYNHTTASMDGEEEDDETVDVEDGAAGVSSPAGNQISVSSPDPSIADHSMSSDQ